MLTTAGMTLRSIGATPSNSPRISAEARGAMAASGVEAGGPGSGSGFEIHYHAKDDNHGEDTYPTSLGAAPIRTSPTEKCPWVQRFADE